MPTSANHLGLYSEEIAVTGEHRQRPQAFTRRALIDTALTLDARLARRAPGTRLEQAVASASPPAPAQPAEPAGDGTSAPSIAEAVKTLINPLKQAVWSPHGGRRFTLFSLLVGWDTLNEGGRSPPRDLWTEGVAG